MPPGSVCSRPSGWFMLRWPVVKFVSAETSPPADAVVVTGGRLHRLTADQVTGWGRKCVSARPRTGVNSLFDGVASFKSERFTLMILLNKNHFHHHRLSVPVKLRKLKQRSDTWYQN